jgi:hypothetical protein
MTNGSSPQVLQHLHPLLLVALRRPKLTTTTTTIIDSYINTGNNVVKLIYIKFSSDY